MRPTVFTDVKDDARINREEIFGPVAVLHRFTTEEEVLRRCVGSLLITRPVYLINGLELMTLSTDLHHSE